MNFSYTFANIIHLILAIIFLGYIFVDLFLLPRLKMNYSQNEFEKIKSLIGTFASKIMPKALLVIIVTGIYMLTTYINQNSGFLDTNMQKLLVIKAFLGISIGFLVLYSITYKKIKKSPNPFLKKYLHKIAFTLGVIIVIIAKIMFVVV